MYVALLGRFVSRDPTGLIDGCNVYAHTDNQPTGWLDPTGLAAIRVFFQPMDVAGMGWRKKFIGLMHSPEGRPYIGGAKRDIVVQCWDTAALGSPFCGCPIECAIRATFEIQIWYVYVRTRLGYPDESTPFNPDPGKPTVEGLFGHEQRHILNWKAFLFGLERDPIPWEECALFPSLMEQRLRDKIAVFADDEFNHRNPPPADGVQYPPINGPGTMPPGSN